MCYPCKGCGKCRPKFTQQTCPECWKENEQGVLECAFCGYVFPPRAGVSASATGKRAGVAYRAREKGRSI